MVISLLAGLAIGVTVEKHRITSKKAKTAVVKKKPKPKPVTTVAPKVRPRGIYTNAPPTPVVVGLRQNLLTVNQGQGPFSVALNKATRVEIVKPATRSDIVRGARVLVEGLEVLG